MKPLTSLAIYACAAVALIGCGSSSDDGSSATPTPTQKPASSSAQDAAASQVCSARDDIQAQVKTLSSLSAGSATRADVTSALGAIQADLQKIKGAQPDLAPERKQQVQDAAAAFGTQLKETLKQTVSGLTKTDAQTQAKNAAASLQSAVKQSLEPIDC
jgi:transketolase